MFEYIGGLSGWWQVAAYVFLFLLVIGIIRAMPFIIQALWEFILSAIRYFLQLVFWLAVILLQYILVKVRILDPSKKRKRRPRWIIEQERKKPELFKTKVNMAMMRRAIFPVCPA